jgi:serine/threonine-protein kinase Chk2
LSAKAIQIEQFVLQMLCSSTSVHFKLKKLLSNESSSLIFLIEDLDTGLPIVLKQPKQGCTQTAQEIAILPILSHPGIIKLNGVVQCTHGLAPLFPYAPNGDLYRQLNNEGLPELTVKQIMFQLFDAVAYLHRMGVWHRDLKPENVLVMNDDLTFVVITDFGLSVCPSSATLCDDFCGTLEFSSPELLLMDCYSEKVDVWALGILMFICLTGYHPFDDGMGNDDLIHTIINCDIETIEKPDDISDNAMQLMTELLANAPEKRISAEEALNHSWFNDIRKRSIEIIEQGCSSPEHTI